MGSYLANLLFASAAAVWALLGPLGAADDAERSLRAATGEDLVIRRSEHFILAFDTSERQAKATLRRLEATYADVTAFCRRLEITFDPPSAPLEVVLFADPTAYQAYAERLGYDHRSSFGFYHARSHRTAFFDAAVDPALRPAFARLEGMRAEIDAIQAALRVDGDSVTVRSAGQSEVTWSRAQAAQTLREQRAVTASFERDLRLYQRQAFEMVVQHEGAHHVLFALGVHRRDAGNPAWLMEGLACLFEPPPVSGTPGLAGVNQFRLFDLRRMLELGPDDSSISRERLAALLDADRFIPFEALVTDSSVFEHHEGVWPAYAEAWALAHYLYTSRPADLAAYIRRVNERSIDAQPDTAAALAEFAASFGPPDGEIRDAALATVLAYPAPQAAAELK